MPCAGFRLAGSMPSPAQIRNDFLSRNDFLPVQEKPQVHPQVRHVARLLHAVARNDATPPPDKLNVFCPAEVGIGGRSGG